MTEPLEALTSEQIEVVCARANIVFGHGSPEGVAFEKICDMALASFRPAPSPDTRPQSQGSDEGVRLALKKDNEIAWDLYHAIEKFLGEWASVQNVHVPENLADLHLSFCEVELPTNKHEVEAQLKGLNHV